MPGVDPGAQRLEPRSLHAHRALMHLDGRSDQRRLPTRQGLYREPG